MISYTYPKRRLMSMLALSAICSYAMEDNTALFNALPKEMIGTIAGYLTEDDIETFRKNILVISLVNKNAHSLLSDITYTKKLISILRQKHKKSYIQTCNMLNTAGARKCLEHYVKNSVDYALFKGIQKTYSSLNNNKQPQIPILYYRQIQPPLQLTIYDNNTWLSSPWGKICLTSYNSDKDLVEAWILLLKQVTVQLDTLNKTLANNHQILIENNGSKTPISSFNEFKGTNNLIVNAKYRKTTYNICFIGNLDVSKLNLDSQKLTTSTEIIILWHVMNQLYKQEIQ